MEVLLDVELVLELVELVVVGSVVVLVLVDVVVDVVVSGSVVVDVVVGSVLVVVELVVEDVVVLDVGGGNCGQEQESKKIGRSRINFFIGPQGHSLSAFIKTSFKIGVDHLENLMKDEFLRNS